jgi:hypothetical protein
VSWLIDVSSVHAIEVVDSVVVDNEDDDAIIAPPISASITRQESTDVSVAFHFLLHLLRYFVSPLYLLY